MTAREVTLLGGSPWGFRMHGGRDLHQPLRISRVNPGSKASQQGVREGDLISSINGKTTRNLTNSESHDLLRSSGEQLNLGLNQDGIVSPKRRIYKSSLQENTSTETLKRITTKTITSNSTRLVQTSEKKINGSDDARNEERINVGQNDSGLNNFSTDNIGNGDVIKSEVRAVAEELDYATDVEEHGQLGRIMPNNSRSRKNRRNRNRKRYQPVDNPSNSKSNEDHPSAEVPPHNDEIDENKESRTRDDDDDRSNIIVEVTKVNGDDGENVTADNIDSEKDDVVYESLNFSKRKPRNRLRIEKRSLDTGTRICEITTIENFPCEAIVDHIAGVGILEIGTSKSEEPLVTVLEPIEPLPKTVTSKVDTLGEKNFALALLAKNNSLDIHEVSDSDVEPDNSRVVVVEAESDVEKETVGEILKVRDNGLAKADSVEDYDATTSFEQFYDNLRKDVESDDKEVEKEEREEVPLTAEEEELLKPEPPMSKEVEEKLRCFIEGLNLPSSPEEAMEECNKAEAEQRTKEEEESKSVKKAKKRAILESYFSQTQAANRFLGIIQEEGEKLSEDDEQHIRDFINEEISKYKREERKSIEDDGKSEEEVVKETRVNGKSIPQIVFLKENSSAESSSSFEENIYENIEVRRGESESCVKEIPKVENSVEEFPIIENAERRNEEISESIIETKRAPEPPKRSSSFNNEIEPERPPTPPETDYPEVLPVVPPLPDGVDSAEKIPPVPPVRRKSVHFAEEEEEAEEESSTIPERPPPLSFDEEEEIGNDLTDCCIADSIYENVNLTRSTCTRSESRPGEPHKVRVCQSNVKTEENTVDFIKTLLTVLTQRNTTYQDVQNFLSGFDLGVLPKNIRDIIDELMEPTPRASSGGGDNPEISPLANAGTRHRPSDVIPRRELPNCDDAVLAASGERSDDYVNEITTGRKEGGKNEDVAEVTRGMLALRNGGVESVDGDQLSVKNNSGSEVEEALYTTSALSPTELLGQDSSSSTTSLSTAKYNPEGTSSLTDINAVLRGEDGDGRTDTSSPKPERKLKLLKEDEETKESGKEEPQDSPQPIPYSPVDEFYYTTLDKSEFEKFEDAKPDLLKDLCIKKILSLPYGEQIINEITLPKFNIFKNIQTIQETVSEKHASKSSSDHLNNRSGERNNFEDRSKDEMKRKTKSWMGIRTREDPRVFVCLSPSQQTTKNETSVDNLLDLHKKFVERRSYHEDENREIRTVKKHRVEVRSENETFGSAEESVVGVDDARNGGCSSRWSGDWHIPMSGNRLLEIIKENSVADPALAKREAVATAAGVVPRSKDAIYNYYGGKSKKNCSAASGDNENIASQSCDNRKKMTRVPSLEESLQERLRATRLSDWLNLARRNSVDDMKNAPKMSANLLIDESTNGRREYETTDNSTMSVNTPSSLNKIRTIGGGSVNTISETTEFEREERMEKSSRVVTTIEHRRDRLSSNSIDNHGRRKFASESTSDNRETLKSALTDGSRAEVPVRAMTTTFGRNPISCKSAIIDKSPSTIEFDRRTPAPRKSEVKHNVNPALINDRPEVPPKAKRTVDVDRSCIDTTSIFDRTPPRNHLRKRRNFHDSGERVKKVTALEIMENLKELQHEMKQRHDEEFKRSSSSLPQEYFDKQLNYIEQLEEQLKNVLIAEEEEEKAFEEVVRQMEKEKPRPHSVIGGPSVDIKDFGKFEGNTRDAWTSKEREEDVDKNGFREKDSWHEECRTFGKDKSELTRKDGRGEIRKKLINENGYRISEESKTRERKEERFVVSKRSDVVERVQPRSNNSNKLERPKSAISSAIATSGEKFRQQMYNEYVNKVQEREERKQHKLIKISSHMDLDKREEGTSQGGSIENEFMAKAKNRLDKFGIKLDDSESELEGQSMERVKAAGDEEESNRHVIDGEKFIDIKTLPKHLQEFLKLGGGTGQEQEEVRADGKRYETDLLHEIDKALIFGKGFLFGGGGGGGGGESNMFTTTFKATSTKPGVWSPGSEPPKSTRSPDRSKETRNEGSTDKDKDAGGIPPVWTPSSATASPVSERKEFRPVQFESPVLGRKNKPLQSQSSTEEAPPPWEGEEYKREASQVLSQTITSRIVNSHSAPSQGLNTLANLPRLPRAQNPTITLLQKAREGQLPKGAAYLEEGEQRLDHAEKKNYENPIISPGEIIYTVKKEYENDRESVMDRPKKMADLGPRKFEGIGPITKEGIPLVLRSEVKENNQAKWYKKMYDSLHRAENDEDYITIRYKPRRGTRYGYGSASGYLSEPEPRISYGERSATLDSRRKQRNKENDFPTSTIPRKNGNAAKHAAADVYRNQPGRIEDYEPGRSSIADKETKEWWDEVMDIFDGPFDQQHNTHTAKPYMSHALKESGYESDSTLVFRRREDASPLSPLEQRLAYKTVQRGGDVPLHGLRKPAPERPKEVEPAIEYFAISPTLTRIRIHKKIPSEESSTKFFASVPEPPPLQTPTPPPPPLPPSSSSMIFSQYKRSAPSLAATGRYPSTTSGISSPPPGRPPSRVTSPPSSRAPSPPRRRSSRNNTTLRLYSKVQLGECNRSTNPRHEQCFAADSLSNIRLLRDRLSSNLEKHRKEKEEAQRGRISRTLSSSPVSTRTKTSNHYFSSNRSELAGITRSTSGPDRFRSRATTSSPSPVARQSRNREDKFGSQQSVKRQHEVEKISARRVPSKSPMSNCSSRDSTVDRIHSPERFFANHGTRSRADVTSRKDQAKPKRTKKEQDEACKRLSRSPELASPQEVKRVLLQRQRDREMQTKCSPSGGTLVKSSTTLYSSGRNARQHPQEDKSLKVTVAISSKGRELLRRTSSRIQNSKSPGGSAWTSSRKTSFAEAVEASKTKTMKRTESNQPSESKGSTFGGETPVLEGNNKRKRARDKPQTIVKSAIKKPETILINPEIKERREDKRKSRREERDFGECSKSKSKSSNGKRKDEGAKKKGKKALGKAAGYEVAKELRKLEPRDANVENLLTVEQIRKHQESMKSDKFFQNLFLRNVPSPTPSQVSVLRKCSVLERARIFQGGSNENFKSEPSLRSLNIYLTSRKPVSNSKFKNWERESASSKCSSPYGVSWPGRSLFKKITKFDSLQSIDDYATEFGSVSSVRGRSPDLTRDYHKERSLSEPPLKVLSEQEEKLDPETAPPRPASPSPIRSPACRRIQSLRHPQDQPGTTIVRKARARSAEEVEQRRKLISGSMSFLCKSTSSLNLSQVDRDEYQQYVLEMLHCKRKSKRYKDLHDFYASLERIGELERTTSTGDLRPRLRNEEIIDYDRWKEVRSKERAERELETLYGKLKSAQKEKDFLFRPKEVDQFRWKGDSGLRCKEKSVENIREQFQKLESEESELESSRRRDMAAKKDVYKPLWRGNSVVSVANTLDRRAALSETLKPELPKALGVSRKLWSSLSIDQVNALKSQLNEIYSNESVKLLEIDRPKYETSGKTDFEIVVPPEEEFGDESVDDGKTLHVRCHSMVTPDVCKVLDKPDEGGPKSPLKRSGSISRGRSVERSQSERSSSGMPSMSELEKKRLSLTLSKEVLDKVTEKKTTRLRSSNLGSGSPSFSSASPRTCYSLEMSEDGNAPRAKEKNDFLLVLAPTDESARSKRKVESVLDKWAKKKEPEIGTSVTDETGNKFSANSEVESTTESSDNSVKTVIRVSGGEEVPRKVEFFEKIEGAASTDLRAKSSSVNFNPTDVDEDYQEDDDDDDDDGMKEISNKNSKSFSQSFADLKELFGESESGKLSGLSSYVSRARSTSPRRSPAGSPGVNNSISRGSRGTNDTRERPRSASPYLVASNHISSSESIWKRSESPDPEKYWRAYLKLVKNGTVKRLREKYESLEELPRNRTKVIPIPKRFKSDPELTRNLLKRVIVKGQETADVDWLRRKYESGTPGRGRRRGASPPIPRVPLRVEDLGMPRIHVISKLAELRGGQQRSVADARGIKNKGESKRAVGMIRRKFEGGGEAAAEDGTSGVSILGEMFTSAPNVHELRDIAPYLAGRWVAHRFPNRRDNARSLSSPELDEGGSKSELRGSGAKDPTSPRPRPRAASSSPARPRRPLSILKQPFCPRERDAGDPFANQHFDPSKHRPRYRYQPAPPKLVHRESTPWWPPIPTYTARPTVTFEEYATTAPPPPPKAPHYKVDRQESPRRYVEGEVTIHYRSPVRTEAKEVLSEAELARRSAENMRRVYQEERRRKYLQELHDIDSRRHTDNFTPSQKSPIPLNRYDDFVDDLSHRSRSEEQTTPEPRLVAKALYNFVGQSSRELTFRRGDIIFVRRQVDKNWYEGEHNAMVGLFPFNYVEILPYDGIRASTTLAPKKPHEGQARAKFNFVAQTSHELSLVKGDLVVLTRRVDDNWYEGRIGNRKGIFPISYVEVMAEPGVRTETPAQSKPVAAPAAHSLLANGSAGGKLSMGPHHYTPSLPNSGNAVTEPHYSSLPRMGGYKLQVAPVNETLHIDTHSEPMRYRALYNYRPQNEDELELKENDTVYVMEKCDDGWFVGSSQRTGCFGTFPGNYVERL